jgi:hypothetical protein
LHLQLDLQPGISSQPSWAPLAWQTLGQQQQQR